MFFDTNLTLDFSSNPEELKKMVQENFSSLENPAQDAALVFKEEYVNGEKKIIFSTTGESDGYEIDYNLFLADFSDRLSNLDNSDINLKLVETKAKIHLSDISSLLAMSFKKIGPLFEFIARDSINLTPYLDLVERRI